MRSFIVLLLGLQVFTVTGFSQETVTGAETEKRTITDFHAIEASSGIEVHISKGDRPELALTASQPEYLSRILTEVRDGVLHISRSSDWKFWNSLKNWRIRVYVSYTQLDDLKISSGASVEGKDISLPKLHAHFSSGARLALSGRVSDLQLEGNSGAQCSSYDLHAQTCNVRVNSGAGVHITVDKEISARAGSGGYVRFKGEGMIRDIDVNSGGSVKRQN
jgi:hypothetical protein